jgi:hypothetical protein
MRRSKFPEEKIIGVLREHEACRSDLCACALVGVHPKTYRYTSKRSDVSEVAQLSA